MKKRGKPSKPQVEEDTWARMWEESGRTPPQGGYNKNPEKTIWPPQRVPKGRRIIRPRRGK